MYAPSATTTTSGQRHSERIYEPSNLKFAGEHQELLLSLLSYLIALRAHCNLSIVLINTIIIGIVLLISQSLLPRWPNAQSESPLEEKKVERKIK